MKIGRPVRGLARSFEPEYVSSGEGESGNLDDKCDVVGDHGQYKVMDREVQKIIVKN